MSKIFHLSGRGFSGRCVKVRNLSAREAEELIMDSARLCKDDPSQFALIRLTEGSKRIVEEITEPCSSLDDVRSDRSKWKAVSMKDLDDPNCKIFTAKDMAVLNEVFHREHDAAPSEVDMVLGKAIEISE